MSDYPIPPFYHPTMVFFVDDNADFLDNLSLQLDPGLAYRTFDRPEDALALLNDEKAIPVGRFFSRYRDTGYLPLNNHVINVDLHKVHREVYDEDRFAQVSVVVVDYDMPSMNGLEFCKRIENRAIKKILLTGKADEKLAVHAFNQGIIDRFVQKQDADAIESLNRAIAELQFAYFGQVERMLSDALTIGRHVYLRDPLFAREFHLICKRRLAVEYYLCSEPDGMLLLDAYGKVTLVLIPDDDYLLSQYEIAFEQGAPQELLEKLKSDDELPYFWKEGYWTPECHDWREHLYPAREFEGERRYSYALVFNPPFYGKEHIKDYRAFLNELDQGKARN